jgi:release factor glutamine methyltransferase
MGEAAGAGTALTVAEAIREAAIRLTATSDTARLDAEVLMAHALGASRSDLLLRHMREPAPAGFAELIARRASHEPVAYITGEQEFFGLRFRVSPDVLIPRGDSEVLVERALAARPDARRVLDCGTGSGALLLATLAHLPEAAGVGIDRSAGALAMAQANARALGLEHRARLLSADWTQPGWADALGGPFDLVLANPPYVEADADLAASVQAFEPAGALFAGPEGLDDYRILIPQLGRLFAPGGVALFEIGSTQGPAVSELAQEQGYQARVHADLGGRDRVVEISGIA